jgi:hypothetical protein
MAKRLSAWLTSTEVLQLEEILYQPEMFRKVEWTTPWVRHHYLTCQDDPSIPPHVLLWYEEGEKFEVVNGYKQPVGTQDRLFRVSVGKSFMKKLSGPQAHCDLNMVWLAMMFMAGFFTSHQLSKIFNYFPKRDNKTWTEFFGECCRSFGAGIAESVSNDIYSKVNVTVDTVKDSFSKILKLVEAAALAVCFVNLASACQTVIQWASLLGLVLIPKFGQQLCIDFISLFQKPSAHSDEQVEPFVTVFLTLISVLFTGTISTSLVNNFFRIYDVTGCKDLFKSGSKQAVSKLSDLVITLLRFFVSYRSNETIRGLLARVDIAEESRRTIKEVPELLVEMTHACLACGQMSNDPTLYVHLSEYQELLAKACGVLRVLTSVKEFPFAERVHFTNEYKKLYEAVMNAVNSRNVLSRVEPTVVYLAGPAGIGKTHLAKTICERVARELWPDELQTGAYLYDRNPIQDHWDRYCNQPICKMEECFSRPNAGRETNDVEHQTWLPLVSNAAYGLKMADIKEKKTMFTSEVIVCTSNVAFPETGTVDRAALLRRMHNHVLITWEPNFPARPNPNDPNLTPMGLTLDGSHCKMRIFSQGKYLPVPIGAVAQDDRRRGPVNHQGATAPNRSDEFGQWPLQYLDTTVEPAVARNFRDEYQTISLDNLVARVVDSVRRNRAAANITANAHGGDEVVCQELHLPGEPGQFSEFHQLEIPVRELVGFGNDAERIRSINSLDELAEFNTPLLRKIFNRRYGSSKAMFETWFLRGVSESFNYEDGSTQEQVQAALDVVVAYRSFCRSRSPPKDTTPDYANALALLIERGFVFEDGCEFPCMVGPDINGQIMRVELRYLNCNRQVFAPEDYANMKTVRDHIGVETVYSDYWLTFLGFCIILYSFFVYFFFALVVIRLVKSILTAILSMFISTERRGCLIQCNGEDIEYMLHMKNAQNLTWQGEDRGYEDSDGNRFRWDPKSREWVKYDKSNKRSGRKSGRSRRIRGGTRAHADDWISEMDSEVSVNEGDAKLVDRFASQFVRITYMSDSNRQLTMYGLQIVGNLVLTPRHLLGGDRCRSYRFRVETDTIGFTENVMDDCIFDFRSAKGVSGFDLEKSDGILIKFKSLPIHKSLLGHVCHDVLQPGNFFARKLDLMALVPRISESLSAGPRCTFAVPVGKLKLTGNVTYKDGIYAEYTAQLYTTDIPGLAHGDCGSLLILREDGALRIAGIYVAGDAAGQKNYFQPITRSLIESLTSKVECKGFANYPPVDDEKEPNGRIENVLPPLGRYLHADKPGVSCIPPSEIRPSPLQLENKCAFGHPPNSAPAQLNYKSMQKAVDKKWHEPGFFETAILDRACDWVKQDLALHIKECSRLDIQDAIDGNTHYGQGSRMAMDTSPGLPWSFTKEPGSKGKTSLFNQVDGKWLPCKEVVDAVNDVIECRERGEVRPGLFRGTLKDERRELERVLEAKTRLFTAGAVEKVLADRMLFLDFVVQFKENRLKLPHAYGVNPEATEWHDMAMQHRMMGNKHLAFDYSGFDASESMQLLQSVSECVASCFREGDRKHVICSGIESFNHFVVIDGDLFQYHQGNPSGCTMTTIYNTIANWILLSYAWIKLVSLQGPPCTMDRAFFKENCVIHAYGDDFIATVSDRATWFNGDTIPPILEVCGVKATAPDKGDVSKFTKFEDLVFLSRYFVTNPFDGPKSMIVGPLPKDLIEEIPMWYFKGADVVDYQSTIRTCLRSAALWGREYYSWYVNSLIKTKTGAEFLNTLDVEDIFMDVSRPFSAGMRSCVYKPHKYFGPGRPEVYAPESITNLSYKGFEFGNFEAALGFAMALVSKDENPARFCAMDKVRARRAIDKLKREGFVWEEKTLQYHVGRILESFIMNNPSAAEALRASSETVLVYWIKDSKLGAGISPALDPRQFLSFPGKNFVGAVLMEMRRRLLF